MIYRWGEGFRVSGDAQKIGEQLERLRQRHEDELTPELVVKDARREHSPLHGAFEWDDDIAAHEYRLILARKVLAAIVFVPDETPDAEPLRYYVHLDNGRSYYTSIIAAMSDEEKRQRVLRTALKELESWERRYRAYEELAEVFASVSKVREAVPA
jgi:hypothetical protein